MAKLFIFPEIATQPGVFLNQTEQIRLAEFSDQPVAIQEVVRTSTIYPDGTVVEGPTYYGPTIILI